MRVEGNPARHESKYEQSHNSRNSAAQFHPKQRDLSSLSNPDGSRGRRSRQGARQSNRPIYIQGRCGIRRQSYRARLRSQIRRRTRISLKKHKSESRNEHHRQNRYVKNYPGRKACALQRQSQRQSATLLRRAIDLRVRRMRRDFHHRPNQCGEGGAVRIYRGRRSDLAILAANHKSETRI